MSVRKQGPRQMTQPDDPRASFDSGITPLTPDDARLRRGLCRNALPTGDHTRPGVSALSRRPFAPRFRAHAEFSSVETSQPADEPAATERAGWIPPKARCERTGTVA